MGLAFVWNRWRHARNVRPGFMVHRRSPFWMEAHRDFTAKDELQLSLRDSPPTKFLASEGGDTRHLKSLRFVPIWGRPQKEVMPEWLPSSSQHD